MLEGLFLTRFQQSMASSWYRVFQYLPLLERQHIHCTVQSLLSDSYIRQLFRTSRKSYGEILRGYFSRVAYLTRADLSRFDVCYVQYEVFPYWPDCLDNLFALARVPYVVDFDDAIHLAYRRLPLLRAKLDRIIARARRVIVGNEILAEYVRSLHDHVCVIPTVVDLDDYPKKADYVSPGRRYIIGWVGTPLTANRYLLPFGEALQEVGRRFPITLRCVGTNPDFSVPGVHVENIPWSRETVGQIIQKFDAGIMPLIDEPFARGKSGFKLIQYMACGVPSVGSRVGANDGIIRDGVDGLLARSGTEFSARLCDLLESQSLRETLGRASRAKVAEKFCLQATSEIFRRELMKAA